MSLNQFENSVDLHMSLENARLFLPYDQEPCSCARWKCSTFSSRCSRGHNEFITLVFQYKL